ncbi:hypothetical protein ACFUTR_36020 [Streptomyces sp. NPDC057367]|uniref:hypothetical protein n=1 Tax=Streptomyces sp. NPDC057367 TaxID=3346108 RepID=UPI00363EA682
MGSGVVAAVFPLGGACARPPGRKVTPENAGWLIIRADEMRRHPSRAARAVRWRQGTRPCGPGGEMCAVRRRSFIIERHEFQVQGDWVGQVFTGVVTLLVGCSGSGKSTGFESLLYPLGLNSGKIMHAVRS